MNDIDLAAKKYLDALDNATVLEPNTHLTANNAYAIIASIRRMRMLRGERPIGRKIGFTNSRVWPDFGISDPIWGYMFDTTVERAVSVSSVDVSNLLEPRIEPEICFGLSGAVRPEMDDVALIGCIAWVAHGFEIVQSPYPNWKLGAADAIVANGMHGQLLLGQRNELTPQNSGEWLRRLTDFELTLACDGKTIDHGSGRNVLGGPLSALRHLAVLLTRDAVNPDLAAGEIVTTGSLTGAFPISTGQVWHTELSGISLEGLSIRVA